MTSTSQLESSENQDKVPELPTATDLASFNHRHSTDPANKTSPVHDTRGAPLSRQLSSGSHVDIGFFDPAGVEILRRTLSRQSQGGQRGTVHSTASYTTIAFDEGPFDLEKTLRHVIKRYVEFKPLPSCVDPQRSV